MNQIVRVQFEMKIFNSIKINEFSNIWKLPLINFNNLMLLIRYNV